jgi:hypothetical protein
VQALLLGQLQVELAEQARVRAQESSPRRDLEWRQSMRSVR